ncbi:MAG: glycosyltransferase family 2 protein [Phycisphaerae bacterium]|nr:glycosyltransferase family 2 protein [Phycisphaerae bacterium]
MSTVKFEKEIKTLLAIPVYNEEKYLNTILDAVHGYIRDILVIDDGSTDGSTEILSKRQDICYIRHPKNRGYGQSIIDAIHFAHGRGYDWVITIDCDWQHEPARIPDFLEAIKRNDMDIISGSRYMDDSQQDSAPPSDRQNINMKISALLNRRLGLSLTDAFCGFKAFRVARTAELDLSESGYAFPLEFWVQVVAGGLRVREIPVSLIYNDSNRYFGGDLDDADVRYSHYLDVFERALEKSNRQYPTISDLKKKRNCLR